jgi:hypothetical protein
VRRPAGSDHAAAVAREYVCVGEYTPDANTASSSGGCNPVCPRLQTPRARVRRALRQCYRVRVCVCCLCGADCRPCRNQSHETLYPTPAAPGELPIYCVSVAAGRPSRWRLLVWRQHDSASVVGRTSVQSPAIGYSLFVFCCHVVVVSCHVFLTSNVAQSVSRLSTGVPLAYIPE